MPKEILIAGSDITDQEEFQRIFESTDYSLVFSDKAEEALLRIKLFKPDLIIVGTALSGESGLEFCESIKVDPEFKNIPVVLVSGVLDEVTEQDRSRVKADGMVSTPLNETEILSLVEGLMERDMLKFAEETNKGRNYENWSGGRVVGFTPGASELTLDDPGEVTDEEIIELIDVVEEPESRMSIDDLVGAKEEDSYGVISFAKTPAEETGKEEKPFGDLDFLTLDEKEEGPASVAAAAPPETKKEPEKQVKAAPVEEEPVRSEDIFEKIDLEEILAKVEQIQPSLDQEWPGKKEAAVEAPPKPAPPPEEEIFDEKLFSLTEFETALRGEVAKEGAAAELKPFSFEELKVEAAEEASLDELPAEEEELAEVAEEELPEALFEEMLGEEEIKEADELKEEEAVVEEALFQEAAIREVMSREPIIQEAVAEEPKDFPFEMFEEKPEPVPAAEIRAEGPQKEAEAGFKVLEAPVVSQEETSPMVKVFEKQLEEVVAKGVQEMIGDFITKILPEMTQNVMNLTAERIEKMVKEVVPDLAEKAIREEIKRLQKEAKE